MRREGGIAAPQPCAGLADADGGLVVVGGLGVEDVMDGGGVAGELGVVERGDVEGERARHDACCGRRERDVKASARCRREAGAYPGHRRRRGIGNKRPAEAERSSFSDSSLLTNSSPSPTQRLVFMQC